MARSAERRGEGARPSAVRTVKASVFKAKCLELMDEVKERRVEIVVTKRGVVVGKFVPAEESPPNPFGFMRGTVLEEQDIVSPEHDAWADSGSDPLD